MGQTVVRRRPIPEALSAPVILRFTTGKVVVPSSCPLGIQAHAHWHRLEGSPDGEPNCECECVRASRVDAITSAHAEESGTPGSPVGAETGEGDRPPSPAPFDELVRLGAVNVRIDGSSVLGTFRISGRRDANVRISPLEPMPEPSPLTDGRVRYRFFTLGTWGGYVDVEADH